MNDEEIIRRLRDARDAHLMVTDLPPMPSWDTIDSRGASAVRDQPGLSLIPGDPGGWRRGAAFARSLAAAAAVVAMVSIPVAIGAAARGSGRPSQAGAAPATMAGSTPARPIDSCSAAETPADGILRPVPGRTPPAGEPAWDHPTPAFYASLSRNPATLAQQLHANAVDEERYRTGPGGEFTASPETFSDANLAYLELNYLRGFLADRVFPADLEPVVAQTLARLAANPANKLVVIPHAHTNRGCTGTGYTARDHETIPLPALVFDANGNYLGEDATVR